MALDPNVLLTLKDGIQDGALRLTFERKRDGTKLWVRLDAARNDGTWSCTMETGDGRKVVKEFPDADAESELTEAVLTIHNWLAPDRPKN